MSAQVQQASVLSGRQLVLAVTIALHAAAISGLMAWRIAAVMQQPAASIQLTEPIPNPDPPVKTPPRSLGPVIEALNVPSLRNPDIPLSDEVEVVADRTAETAVGQRAGESAVPEEMTPPVDTSLGYRVTRSSDDFYPAQAIRLEQQGVAIVRVCVDANGAQMAAPQVVKSSRSRLLDGAAVAWAKEALQFTPATHAGTAVGACKDFRVNFMLH